VPRRGSLYQDFIVGGVTQGDIVPVPQWLAGRTIVTGEVETHLLRNGELTRMQDSCQLLAVREAGHKLRFRVAILRFPFLKRPRVGLNVVPDGKTSPIQAVGGNGLEEPGGELGAPFLKTGRQRASTLADAFLDRFEKGELQVNVVREMFASEI